MFCMNLKSNLDQLFQEFQSCQNILTAIGDEMRQYLILVMLQSGQCSGMRVGDIASRTNLSRPAVSHHLKILKDAGIIKMRREGTKNYYYFDADMEAFDQLIDMLVHAKTIMLQLPDRSGKEDL